MSDFERVASAIHARLCIAHPSITLEEINAALADGLANGPEYNGEKDGYVLYIP